MRTVSTPIVQPAIPYGALVGQVVQRLRKEAKLDQAELAKALNISQSAYSRLEKGESAMTLPQFRSIATRFGLTPSNLLRQVDSWESRLHASGVTVTETKDEQPGAILLALGILAALIAAGGK